jgi:hypothetical protein
VTSFVDEYCQKMKATANALHDVSHIVLDSQLVLNLLLSLNPCLSSTDNIIDSNSLSEFAMACKKLVLKELHLANEGKIASQTALYAGSPSCGTACRTTSFGMGA